MEDLITKQTAEVKCLVANQPIGPMFIAVMDYDVLEYISFTDVRRLEQGVDEREIESYSGIQRELNKNREKEIGKYVNLVDATFPNSIILAISSEHAKYDEKTQTLTIDYQQDVAKVLDGQHRIAGLNACSKPGNQFQCIVTIYVDMELEDQAIVFATINKEQKSVSKSLAADLFEFAKSRSPQKTGHNIARALDNLQKSPFKGKIKILGTAIDKDKETITQDTFVKSIIKYISSDPQKDRNDYKENKNKAHYKLPFVSGKEQERLFLRNMFIDDDSDTNIAQLIYNYFSVIQSKWPIAWNEVKKNNILNKSTGFMAFMDFLKNVYHHIGKIDQVPTKEDFAGIINPIDIPDDSFTNDNYIPGGSGKSKLYQELLEKSGLIK